MSQLELRLVLHHQQKPSPLQSDFPLSPVWLLSVLVQVDAGTKTSKCPDNLYHQWRAVQLCREDHPDTYEEFFKAGNTEELDVIDK